MSISFSYYRNRVTHPERGVKRTAYYAEFHGRGAERTLRSFSINVDLAFVLWGGFSVMSFFLGCVEQSAGDRFQAQQTLGNATFPELALKLSLDPGAQGFQDQLKNTVAGLIATPGRRREMAEVGRHLVDGLGAERVVDVMLQVT